jgi:hypothetical protein
MRLVLLMVACSQPTASFHPAHRERFVAAPKDAVDVLFVLDDSPGTTAKVNGFTSRFPEILARLRELADSGHPASYHFGVITTDLGADAAGTVCKPGGDGGRMWGMGRAHAPGCLPTVGANFLIYDQINGSDNTPPAQDLAATFACMSKVGSGGCGFEHVLESAYRALHDCPSEDNCTIPENRGFLRQDAALVVFFVTDEDDCSAPPDTDLFVTDAPYGLRTSFRCTNYGVVCNQNGTDALPPYGDSGGPLTGCHGAPNPTGNVSGLPPPGEGKLFDVQRYIDFFSTVKGSPNDVFMAAIDAPSEPFATLLGNASTGMPCSGPPVPGCEVYLGHSCNANLDWFGDPAVRLNQVIESVPHGEHFSVCDITYGPAIDGLVSGIAAQVKGHP